MSYYGIELGVNHLNEVDFVKLESGDTFCYQDAIYMKINPLDVYNFNTICITHGDNPSNIRGHMFLMDDDEKVCPVKTKLIILK